MLDLSPETEALVRTLAEARKVSVDAAVREAVSLRLTARRIAGRRGRSTSWIGPPALARNDGAGDLAARRVAALRRYAKDLSKLPDLDPRSAKEIMDDLNLL